MTVFSKTYSKIIGTGSYLPEKRVTNQDLTEQLAAKGIETSDEWIVSRSGISAISVSLASTTSRKALASVWRALRSSQNTDNAPVLGSYEKVMRCRA